MCSRRCLITQHLRWAAIARRKHAATARCCMRCSRSAAPQSPRTDSNLSSGPVDWTLSRSTIAVGSGFAGITEVDMRVQRLNSSMIARGAAAALLVLANAVVSEGRPAPVAPLATEAPAGNYTLDKAHGTLAFRVDHLGFSNYTARFDRFDATLRFDPQNPVASSVTATVDVSSLDVPTPPTGFLDTLLGAKWFDAGRFPQMTFRSTKVESASPNAMRIHGELEFRGVKRPVTL